MQVGQLLRIAGIGVLVTVIVQILNRAGREDMAMLTTVAGLVIVLSLVVSLVAELFASVQSIFGLY
ncbi:MAG: stage III sporulation protein AC [Clostridia bacterium]|nr:stage III sporulation protein AC [Clostridia bacterium]